MLDDREWADRVPLVGTGGSVGPCRKGEALTGSGLAATVTEGRGHGAVRSVGSISAERPELPVLGAHRPNSRPMFTGYFDGYNVLEGKNQMISNHAYSIGTIEWDGLELNAVVISDLTRQNIEEELTAAALANWILAGNPDISAAPAKWAVFAQPHYLRRNWQLLGSGSGTKALPPDQAPSGEIPEDVVRQLEEISLP